jgi:DNA-binding MarR family transcriptional regulator
MGAAKKGPAGTGPGGRKPLPPLIHGRVRLLILSFLVRSDRPPTFTETRAALGLTDGSLSANLRQLEDGGLVEMVRGFVGRRPQTLLRLTPLGHRRFAQYVADLRKIIPGL